MKANLLHTWAGFENETKRSSTKGGTFNAAAFVTAAASDDATHTHCLIFQQMFYVPKENKFQMMSQNGIKETFWFLDIVTLI